MPRRTVARLSDPAFKELIVKRAAFEPATASVSRSMVASSLRGIMLDKERDIAIELSAGSAADVQSAFRAIAAEIGAAHTAILDRQLEVVQNRIDEDKGRTRRDREGNRRVERCAYQVNAVSQEKRATAFAGCSDTRDDDLRME